MAERLKDIFFTRESLTVLADAIHDVYPRFDRTTFMDRVFQPEWASMELKDRMHRVTRAMAEILSLGFGDALPILKAVAPEIQGFDGMVFPDYVEMYGQEDWDTALPSLAYFTCFASAEFAIRPYLDQDPERTLPYLLAWAEDRDPQVRRLASEGCRPRLPWAMSLPKFKADPRPILPILEKLKDDEAETVRRSVANNLNDISKDHPEITLEICTAWKGYSEQTDWIVKHACRSLLKAGDRQALALFGFGDSQNLSVENLTLDKDTVVLGEDLSFTFSLIVGGEKPHNIRLEYGLDFAKARGRRSRKIFKISEKTYLPGSHSLRRKHAVVALSTRKHYPGHHELSIITNGEIKALVSFELLVLEQ